MFRWIIGSSLQFRFVVVGFAAALVVYGIIQLQKMPVDVFPEFAAPTVKVQTEAIGLSAEEVESLITLNLEDSEERAHFFGKQQLLYTKLRDVPQYFKEIDGVTKEQVDHLAKRVLTHEALRLVVIGQEENKAKLEELVA